MKLFLLILGVVIVTLAVAGGGYYKFVYTKDVITPEAAKTRASDFINKNLLKGKATAEIESVTKAFGLYEVMVKVGGKEITSYMTLDGKLFFPDGGLNIDELSNAAPKDQAASASSAPSKPADIAKSDVPQVSLFVMSYCPYGTQIEKGILPVLSALGSKIRFNLEFVDYSMHGKKELDENLKQYCIQKNEPTKLATYLGCFLKDSAQGDACIASSGIDQAKLSSCIASTDSQFKVTDNYNDKSTWSGGNFPPFNVNKDDNTKYGVQGSPTLVVNGTEVDGAARDSKGLLDTICSAFSTKPAECGKTLSSDAPAPGFGEGTASADSGTGGNCGN